MQSTIINIQNIDLALYERQGKKPTLFFVHGNSSNAHAFESVWADNSLHEYHLMAIDLPGHGNSSVSPGGKDYSMDSLAKIIASVIEKKNLKSVILVAHSIGGHIALTVLKFSDRVVGIALAGTGPLNGAQDLQEAYIISEVVQTAFKAEATPFEVNQFTANAVYKRDKAETLVHSFYETDKRFREEMGLELSRHFGSADFVSEIELLKAKNIPVCLIHGMQEKVVNLNHLKSLDGLNLFENKVHLIQDAGHCVPFEKPSAYSKVLSRFTAHVFRDVEMK